MSYSSEVLADSPLAYWRLGEASGTTTVDSSGNGKDGTYSGTVTHVTGLLPADADTCVDFNGTDTQSDTPQFPGADYVTVEALISLDATGKEQTIHARANEAAGSNSFRFYVTSGDKLAYKVWLAAGGSYTATGATSLATGVTHHVVGTFDGTTVQVYLDGVADGSTSQSGTITKPTPLGGLIGASYNGSIYARFDGKMDEVAYYGSALSSSRVAAHYAAATVAAPDATVTPPAATATAAAVAPVVSASRVVLPPAATATAAALPPTIGAGGNATVSPPAATATATALAPTITQIIPAGTDTSNSLNGRRRRARASVVVTLPAAAVPSRAAVKYDKSVPYPPPTLVNGRPT